MIQNQINIFLTILEQLFLQLLASGQNFNMKSIACEDLFEILT
jgi:hypothetical protein